MFKLNFYQISFPIFIALFMFKKITVILASILLFIAVVLLFGKKIDQGFGDEIIHSKAYPIFNPEVLSGSNSSLIWQGFYHQWYINHRLNRLGDFIEDVKVSDSLIQAKLVHTAASGSASDVLDYTSFFSYINTQKATFAASSVNLHIYGKEGNELTKIVKVKGKFEEKLKSYKNAVVILNGLDIRSSTKEELLYGNGKADKLISFKTRLDNLKINNGDYEFMIDLKFNADCDSPECIGLNSKKNKWYDYQVKIGYQIVFYNDDVNFQDALVTNSYAWEKKRGKVKGDFEIHRDDLGFKRQEVKGKKGFTHALPMINSIEVQVPKAVKGKNGDKSKAVHLLALDIALPQFNYNPLEAICTFDACLFFKNWTYKMHPLSNTFAGEAHLNLGVKIMQVNDKNTMIESHQISDRINWKTNHLNQSVSTNEYSSKESVFIKGL